jgi:poly(hydroxyalkanoate) depolymerase family esterase
MTRAAGSSPGRTRSRWGRARGAVQAVAGAALMTVVACAGEGDRGDGIGISSNAATLTEVTGFGSNPGNLRMLEYVPAGLPSGAPLVVAMHGCTQSANELADRSEWNELADRFGFAVVYPEQRSANNFALCFNWFEPSETSRGQGEALSIAQMVSNMLSRRGSDPDRVFATGMSSGGYMTEVMMATYPDLFAGGAVHAGGAFRCATSVGNSSACQQGTVSRTPQQWGDLVRGAFPGHAGPYPRLIAFHGSSDFLVNAANLDQSVAQWSDVLGVDRTADVDETFRTARHRVYRDGDGRATIETFLVTGMGHGLTVDPGGAADQGGTTGAFSEDRDIYSSYYAALFWGLTGDDGGGDDGSDDGGTDDGTDDGGGDDGDGDGGGALVETFSTGGGPDNTGWSLGGWTVDVARDATGAPGSRSLAASARPSFGTVTRTATWSGLALGAAPTLTYERQLSLAGVNLSASTSFRVIVHDGADHVVDSRSTTGLTQYRETSWTSRSVDLTEFAGQTVSLTVIVTASDPASTLTAAQAWVDDIRVE